MKIKFIQPRAEIAPFISIFWIFESSNGLPANDSRMIVPNGTAKIIIPVRNRLYAGIGQNEIETKEEKIHVSGLCDRPTIIKSQSFYTSTIGISLTTIGASKLLPFPMKEFKNSVYSFEDIFGSYGKQLEQRLANTESIDNKIDFVQTMISQLIKQYNRQNSIITFCIREIKRTNGLIRIKDLEKKTGYSKRYLDLLFDNYIGVSPKLLSGITRFNVFYHQWAKSGIPDFYRDLLYEYYFDQSHFIKEFKRFSGHSPKQFDKIGNDFGKLFI